MNVLIVGGGGREHALAWKIHETHPAAEIRPEYKPSPDEPIWIDIWVSDGERSAIEPKYLTRRLEVEVG
ncbi:MAG: hypothetical protein IIA63_11640, partial [Nitrospinae bacterium]|nr:hypothetical protein [Nitrospinota bacterium]